MMVRASSTRKSNFNSHDAVKILMHLRATLGNEGTAKLFGIGESTLFNWSNNSIPKIRIPEILKIGRDQGQT